MGTSTYQVNGHISVIPGLAWYCFHPFGRVNEPISLRDPAVSQTLHLKNVLNVDVQNICVYIYMSNWGKYVAVPWYLWEIGSRIPPRKL